MTSSTYYLLPGEKIPEDLLNQLKQANDQFSRKKNFSEYKRNIEYIFRLKPITNVTKYQKFYMAGYVGGEGSLNISAKKLETARFGLMLDPEFSITQHLNSVSDLYLALCVFQTGRIRYKAGSNATLSFIIDNRQSLEEKVLPFLEDYYFPYGSEFKKDKARKFQQLLRAFREKKHLDRESFAFEMLPIWADMRMQTGQVNQTFQSLKEAQDYVLNAKPDPPCFEETRG